MLAATPLLARRVVKSSPSQKSRSIRGSVPLVSIVTGMPRALSSPTARRVSAWMSSMVRRFEHPTDHGSGSVVKHIWTRSTGSLRFASSSRTSFPMTSSTGLGVIHSPSLEAVPNRFAAR